MRSKRRLVAKARAIQNQGRTTIKILPAAMLAVALLVVACGSEQAESPADAADPTESLHALFDEFFERGLELNPMSASRIGDYRFNDQYANSIGPEYREANRQLDEKFLARLLNINREQLVRQDRLSYDLFRYNRCLLYTSPSPRDRTRSRMPSSA